MSGDAGSFASFCKAWSPVPGVILREMFGDLTDLVVAETRAVEDRARTAEAKLEVLRAAARKVDVGYALFKLTKASGDLTAALEELARILDEGTP